MKRKLIMASAAILVLAATSGAYAADASLKTGKQFAKDATVSEAQARETALKAFPGKIVDAELEQGKAGSGLHYSFDILAGPGCENRKGSTRREIGIRHRLTCGRAFGPSHVETAR